MARAVKDHRIGNRTQRSALKVQHEPYWRTLYEGAALGYRKGPRGGVWVARVRPVGSAYRKTTLGRADDHEDADGYEVLDYRQAQEAAREWFDKIEAEARGGRRSGPYTVADAVSDYLADYEARGGKAAKDARQRAEARILPRLGETILTDLTTPQIKAWHRGLAAGEGRGHKATANRLLTILKAALNHAWREGRIEHNDAWQRVQPFKGADAARVRYLSTDEVTRLVNACQGSFRAMVQAALYTGCRYGELTRLVASDFNPDAGTAAVHESKSGKPRHVILTEEGQRFFQAATVGLDSDGLIFRRDDGEAWGKSHQHRPLAEACARAGLKDVTFHALRHTYASHLAMNGVPLQVVAANLGHTDTRMVEKHYGHIAPSFAASAIRGAGLGYVVPESESNVTALRPRAAV